MLLLTKQYRYAINIDWLSFTGLLDYQTRMDDLTMSCPSGYRLEVEKKGTNIFSKRAILYDIYGHKVLTCLWSPKNTFNSFNLVMWEIANYFLYGERIKQVLHLTQMMHPYKYVGFTRLDICCDFELVKEAVKIYKGLCKGTIYVANKKCGSRFWSDGGRVHCMSWGSKSSDYKWKLYDKTKELKATSEAPDKQYIIDEWKLLGMQINNIWRLEVSITSGNKLMFEDETQYKMMEKVDWDTGEVTEELDVAFEKKSGRHRVKGLQRVIELSDICNDRFVYRLFVAMVNRRFVLRKDEGHTRRSNDTIVHLLQCCNLDFVARFHVKKYEKRDDEEHVSIVTEVNQLVTRLQSKLAMVDKDYYDSVAKSLRLLVSKYRLNKWFDKQYGVSVRGFVEECAESAGLGVIEV